MFLIRFCNLFSQQKLVDLHECLEEDLDEAESSGKSLGEWRMEKKLLRNEEMKKKINEEFTRVLAHTITTPLQQERSVLLDKYLDQVSLMTKILDS